MGRSDFDYRYQLRKGLVIPAHPLALTASRKLDETRQRALSRYYLDAGAGGLAIGVHTTQFAIRDVGLFEPVLELALEEMRGRDVVRIAGVCSLQDAEVSARLGYHAGLLSLAPLPHASIDELIDYARAAAAIIPLFGFYLQPAAGGRVLPREFWRRFVEIEQVVAIKVAPFNRYATLDVLLAVERSGRANEIALYTGNDDNIVGDLLTPPFVGGLLGHWAFATRRAVELLETIHAKRPLPPELGRQITDLNAAVFDAANNFRGCIPGIHEMLRRQGLLAGRWCLDPNEDLSPGQMQEIDRVSAAYPHLLE